MHAERIGNNIPQTVEEVVRPRLVIGKKDEGKLADPHDDLVLILPGLPAATGSPD
jgi:hypothetical protein